MPIPLSVEVIVVVWLCAFPSKCRGGCESGFVGIPLVRSDKFLA